MPGYKWVFTHLNLSGPRWWCLQSRFGRGFANSRFYPKAPSGSPRCFLASKFPLAFSPFPLLFPRRFPLYPVTSHRVAVHFPPEHTPFLLRPTPITFFFDFDAFQRPSTFVFFFLPFIRVNGSTNFHPTVANFHSFKRRLTFLTDLSLRLYFDIPPYILPFIYTLYISFYFIFSHTVDGYHSNKANVGPNRETLVKKKIQIYIKRYFFLSFFLPFFFSFKSRTNTVVLQKRDRFVFNYYVHSFGQCASYESWSNDQFYTNDFLNFRHVNIRKYLCFGT